MYMSLMMTVRKCHLPPKSQEWLFGGRHDDTVSTFKECFQRKYAGELGSLLAVATNDLVSRESNAKAHNMTSKSMSSALEA